MIGHSIEPSAEATSPVGYVRWHGRRYDTWFSDDAGTPSHERYNYLYSAEELAPWVPRIRKVTEKARDVFVVTNNHYQGKRSRQRPATDQSAEKKVKVLETLRQHCPELEAIAAEHIAEPTLFPSPCRSVKK